MEPTVKLDKHGFSIKPTITDDELLILCLSNAPCGTDRKQVQRLEKGIRERVKLFQSQIRND